MRQQPEIFLCLRIFKDATAVKICASLRPGDEVDNHTQKDQDQKQKISNGDVGRHSLLPLEIF